MRSRRSSRVMSSLRRIATASGIAMLADLATYGCTELTIRPDVTIGATASTGTDYSLGGSICRLFNLDTPRHHLRCQEVPSIESVANINALRSGRIDIGIVQSDVLADAAAGRASFASAGPAHELRILFSGHDELFTVVARSDLGIRSFADLRGRRISIGISGSRQHAEAESVMIALGLTRNDFADVRELAPVEQHSAFCGNEIDAIVYSVSHPSGLIRDVTRTCGGILVGVSAPTIARVMSEHQEYERGKVPGGIYVGNPTELRTFGVRAAVVATERLSETAAYEITKAVFENIEAFRRLHPAFGALKIVDMIRPNGLVPIHVGALHFYREHDWMPRAKTDGN